MTVTSGPQLITFIQGLKPCLDHPVLEALPGVTQHVCLHRFGRGKSQGRTHIRKVGLHDPPKRRDVSRHEEQKPATGPGL